VATHKVSKPLHLKSYFSKVGIVMHRIQDPTSAPEYNPNKLLDAMLDKLKLTNDAALARALEVAPPIISKIRHRHLPVNASMLIRMHEVSNMEIRELQELMGDRRSKFRLSNVQGMPKEGARMSE
jgi:plasmid maintenance system antidote protein VapI